MQRNRSQESSYIYFESITTVVEKSKIALVKYNHFSPAGKLCHHIVLANGINLSIINKGDKVILEKAYLNEEQRVKLEEKKLKDKEKRKEKNFPPQLASPL